MNKIKTLLYGLIKMYFVHAINFLRHTSVKKRIISDNPFYLYISFNTIVCVLSGPTEKIAKSSPVNSIILSRYP